MSRFKFIFSIFSFVCACIYMIYWNSNKIEVLYSLCFFNLAYSLIPLIKHKDSPYLGPIFFILSYVVYSLLIGRYLYPDLASSINSVIDYEFDFLGLFILFLFIFGFTFFINEHNEKNIIILPQTRSSKNIAISFLCISMALILQFIFMEPVQGNRGNYSPIYEYSVVFCIPALYYSLRHKYFKFFIILVLIFMIFRDFSLGHRALGVQLTMLIYALYFYKFYTFKRLLICFFIALLIFNYVASFRSDFIFNLDSVFSSISYLLTEQLLASNTAYFAWVASLTFLSVQTLVPFSEIMVNFVNFLISMIIPGTFGESLYTISKEYYQHVNGGILPIYMFYYLNFAAIPFITFILAFYFNLIKTNHKNTFKILLFIYIFVTSPRWLIYAPTGLFRGAAIFSLIVIAIFMFKYLLSLMYLKKIKNV